MTDKLPEWAADLARCVDDKLMRDIVSDGRAHQAVISRGGNTAATNREAERGTGWRESPQVDSWKPPGVEHCDRLMDQADMIDKAEKARQLMEAAKNLKALREAEEELEAEKLDPEPKGSEK
jgi:hypothetical protein